MKPRGPQIYFVKGVIIDRKIRIIYSVRTDDGSIRYFTLNNCYLHALWDLDSELIKDWVKFGTQTCRNRDEFMQIQNGRYVAKTGESYVCTSIQYTKKIISTCCI